MESGELRVELPRFLLLYAETCCGGNFGNSTLHTPNSTLKERRFHVMVEKRL